MVEVQERRGPDGRGSWSSPSGYCTLGHTRLAIIDLTDASSQPYVVADGRFALTYNGELYNYRELREQLRGFWDFHSTGDTEVVLAAYAKWGAACVERFNGMFALGIWDEARRELFLARDRFGEKPLYYATVPGGMAFASEIRALALHGADMGLDQKLAVSYLLCAEMSDTDARERTLFQGVRQLLPAHRAVLTIDAEGRVREALHPSPYWSLLDVERRGRGDASDYEQSIGQLRELFTDSVRLRLRSDVEVGTCLSGGLDSSAVVSTIRRLDPDRVINTFTGRFPGKGTDEGPYALAVGERFGTQHHEVTILPEGFEKEAADVYSSAELPIGGFSQYGQFCVFRLAQEHGVTVLLDGQGSDELFGGYGFSIYRAYLSGLLGTGRFLAAAREWRAGWRTNPDGFAPVGLAKYVLYDRVGRFGREGKVRPVLTAQAQALLGPDVDGSDLAMAGAVSSSLSRLLARLSTRTMLTSLLRYGDHLSMRFSREVRLPFCDHRVAELAFSFPPEYLLGGHDLKRVVRDAFRAELPAVTVDREKHGFRPDSDSWLGGHLRHWAADVVDSISPELEAVIDRRAATDLATRNVGGAAVASDVLWRVANLAAWDLHARRPFAEIARGAVADDPTVAR